MKKDGHIHTPYCPHGTKDHMKHYINRAIEQGFTDITFTEHAPLPIDFIDPAPAKDSAMKNSDIANYLDEVEQLKQQYKKELNIHIGLEVDYIEGYEDEITAFLNKIGPSIDDAILSVHFLKGENGYHCLDYSPDVFQDMINEYGSIDAVYQHYFRTVQKSILSDLGQYKPTRIGHITLVKKFQKKFPVEQEFEKELSDILNAVKDKHYELDYNAAGLIKPLCLESYPPASVAQKAMSMGIPLVYGSDAHQAKLVGYGWSKLNSQLQNI
ncbi:histidinol-phosphatase HisJ [Cytobacillus sp. FSL W7-1323]|uniref:histidinol-phosphatase HisJ n=1 Tax=unclassified Cytobacillus TaxID=2675268 RepID=UPI002AFFECB5|nr:histidinol-phosphatase HisJ [Cytobacillus sp. OWB-43]MEA1855061.1 histidinol-phosphatase HisJ [Cytobacillus sp. OWB-43]